MTIDNGELKDTGEPSKAGIKASMPRATHSGTLTVGDTALPCVVLDDDRRVFAVQGIHKAFHITTGTASLRRVTQGNAFPLPQVLSQWNAPPIYPEAAKDAMASVFYIARNHRQGHGIEADGLEALCDVWLMARDHMDRHGFGLYAFERVYVEVAQRLVDALTPVGVYALIDEATGYGAFAARRDLESLLERSADKNLFAWTRVFPDAFFQELFRLRGWDYIPLRVPRQGDVGGMVQNIVYDRLDPVIVEELRRKPPRAQAKGTSQNQPRPMEAVGHHRLRDHLVAVTTLMRVSGDWRGFQRSLQRAFPGPDDEGSMA